MSKRCATCGPTHPGMRHRPECSGDIYARRFSGGVAQCGCRWVREAGYGDVLQLCPLHAEHSALESGGGK
jgi:hypothetical protein